MESLLNWLNQSNVNLITLFATVALLAAAAILIGLLNRLLTRSALEVLPAGERPVHGRELGEHIVQPCLKATRLGCVWRIVVNACAPFRLAHIPFAKSLTFTRRHERIKDSKIVTHSVYPRLERAALSPFGFSSCRGGGAFATFFTISSKPASSSSQPSSRAASMNFWDCFLSVSSRFFCDIIYRQL
jgi:hypothetical protein